MERFIFHPNFVAMERIDGIPYVTMKLEHDSECYRYGIFKIKNENYERITRCDTKAQARNYLKQLRMDLRDERVRRERESRIKKGIYNGTCSNEKTIIEAYLESIDVI